MRRNFTIDTLTPLKDAGLVAVSGAAEVASAAKVLDLGSGFVEGHIVLDVTAIEEASKDETFDVVVQLSPDADFGTAGNIVERMAMHFGAKEIKRTDCDRDDATGRYVLPFDNEFGGTVYRYLRLYTVVGGTIATGINYTANLVKS
jgi:hypothetical protein